MRIAVVGAGGVGGGYGAALAKAGAEVSFLARGAQGANPGSLFDQLNTQLSPKSSKVRR